jgi:hypothetical protein
VDDLRVSAWKRYGKDRLYVNTLTNTLTGETVGWQDRRTGEVHIEIEALGPAARAALAAYHRLHPLARYSLRDLAARPPGLFARLLGWLMRRPVETDSWSLGIASRQGPTPVAERVTGTA